MHFLLCLYILTGEWFSRNWFNSNFQQNHFVRCLKANDDQKWDLFDTQFVERQLTTTGTDVLLENECNLWQCKLNVANIRSKFYNFVFNKWLLTFLLIVGEKTATEIEDDSAEPPTKIAKQSSESPSNSSETNSRFDLFDHWVLHDDYQSGSRCKYNKCNKTIHTYCSKCHVYLCSIRNRNCFNNYHFRK